MYFRYAGVDGASPAATTSWAPAGRASAWYFAEGNTGAGFDEYLTIMNPGGSRERH